jgi:inorganic pyrophosphatase/exopolyphosphatase
MVFITSYINPDLDGIGCAIAYKEYLDKLGQESQVIYTGTLGAETNYIADYLGGLPINKDSGVYPPDSNFVLVDIADPQNLNENIDLTKVIRVFDHHLRYFPEKFPNAKVVIDKVGSCSTLLVEFFQSQKHTPNQVSAILLYSAIISNTVNFQNSVTTDRDKKAAAWLKGLINIPNNYIKNMFQSKSNINSNNLEEAILQDFAVKTLSGKNIGIAQIEVVDLIKLVDVLKSQLIDLLHKFKSEKQLDYVLFTGIDILLGFNYLIVIDSKSGELVSKALSLPLFTSETKTAKIIMRKQIWPLLETILSSNSASL